MVRNLAARRRFATLLREHLQAGTRPGGIGPDRWTYAAFAAEVMNTRDRSDNDSVSESSVRNWCNVEKPVLPMAIGPILRALFGTGDRHAQASEELLAAFKSAGQEPANGADDAREVAPAPPSPPPAPEESTREETTDEEAIRQEANRELDEAESAIKDLLVSSPELLPCFGEVILSPKALPRIKEYVEFWQKIAVGGGVDAGFLAELLLNRVGPSTLTARNSLVLLRAVSASFRNKRGHNNWTSFTTLQRIAERVALLIVGAKEIKRVRDQLAEGPGALVTLPATNTTMVEIVMTRIEEFDERGPLFRRLKGKRHREGVYAISHPPYSGPDSLSKFGDYFENELFEMLLMPNERADLDVPSKLELVREYLSARTPKLDRTLYFIAHHDIHKRDQENYDAFLKKFAEDWPGVYFVRMSEERDLRGEQSKLLANILDMFRDADIDE